MASPDDLLSAYDEQLRVEAELIGTSSVVTHPPLWWAEFDDGDGFVTYADLGGLEGTAVDALIAATVAHFRDDTGVSRFEWKTRGHDHPLDLGARLEAGGLVPEEEETVMIGEAAALAAPVVLPAGVVVRRAGAGTDLTDDVARATQLQDAVFGRDTGRSLESVVAELRDRPAVVQLWLAEVDDTVVSAGRLVRVPGTDFAGLWGGATHGEWRGQGIYRALTAARARAAIELGARFLHSDCTAMSRPILERSGLHAVTTTTPYLWRRS